MLKKIAVAASLATCFAAPSFAQQVASTADAAAPAQAAGNEGTVLVYGVGGLGGVGGGLGFEAVRNLVVRGEYARYEHNVEHTDEDYAIDAKIKLQTQAIFADYHPFSGAFRLVLGANFNGPAVDGIVRPREGGSATFGGNQYTFGPNDKVTADIRYPSVMPYFGLGWGLGDFENGGFAFGYEIGVNYGSPKTQLQAHGNLANDPQFVEDMKKEEEEMNRKAQDFRFFPIVKLSIGYVF